MFRCLRVAVEDRGRAGDAWTRGNAALKLYRGIPQTVTPDELP